MKKALIVISIFFFTQSVTAQSLSNYHKKRIEWSDDSVFFDTLSIVPGSFSVLYNDVKLHEDQYTVDYSKASLFIFQKQTERIYGKGDSLTLIYRSLPINLSKNYAHKERHILYDSINRNKIKRYLPSENTENFFSNTQLNKSGSISRGITFGNNQDASVSSDFNMQLAGNLSPEISVTANISDSNIPIQADGTSQHLREFDKVFIELKSKKSKLIVGDFEINKPKGYYLNFHKKVKGAGYSINFNPTNTISVNSRLNAAISKGKFNRQKVKTQEGNQGPYKLYGSNNELFVVILSGSEKIYINGELLLRGSENDYIIDYNAGEITFTAKSPITKDSRIIAEFEYSEQSYARFALSSENIIKTKHAEFYLNLISEHDAKNQSLRQDLSDDHKLMLYSAGDDINNAFIENSIPIESFNTDEILYRKTDTLAGSTLYEGIYVHTNDSSVNVYRLGFSYVGDNSGSYIRVQNGSNGRVFEWVAPIEGILQGNYEPVRLLVSPKKKQMLSFGGLNKLKNNSKIFYELALSNNDLNQFSTKDDGDNYGYALKVGIEKNILKKDTNLIFLNIGSEYMLTDKQFEAFEPYRTVEFERDWNLTQSNTRFNEHLLNVYLNFFKKDFGSLAVETDLLKRDTDYFGNNSKFNLSVEKEKFSADIHFDYLRSNDTVNITEFIRYNTKLERKFPFLIIGFKDSGEKNSLNYKGNDSISLGSFRFNQWETYLKLPVSKKRSLTISYINREDFLPKNESLGFISSSHDFKLYGNLINTKKQSFNTNITYRQLNVSDTSISDELSENTLSGKLRHSLNILKGSVSTTSFIEHISGNELIREYSYIEVQTGQGIFAWKDFNENNIKELNEFVRANFQDEANYIRVSLPGNEYRKVFSQNFFQAVNLVPRRIWFNEKGLKKYISMFSNRFSYKLNRKLNHSADYASITIPDTALLSLNSTFKNNLSFEIAKTGTKLNYTLLSNKNKVLLVNGIDTRTNYFHHINLNQRIYQFVFLNSFKNGYKTYNSEFFTFSDFHIDFYENKSAITYKADKKNDITANLVFKEKTNRLGEEHLRSYSAGGEYKFTSLNQGRFTAKFDFINIQYNETANTSVSYEILEALQSGKNYIWSLLWYKQISEYLLLELNYSGRKAGENKVIHTGGLSLRAIF